MRDEERCATRSPADSLYKCGPKTASIIPGYNCQGNSGKYAYTIIAAVREAHRDAGYPSSTFPIDEELHRTAKSFSSNPMDALQVRVFRLRGLKTLRDVMTRRGIQGWRDWTVVVQMLSFGLRPMNATVGEWADISFPHDVDGKILVDGAFPTLLHQAIGPEKRHYNWKRLTHKRIDSHEWLCPVRALVVWKIMLHDHGYRGRWLFPKFVDGVATEVHCSVDGWSRRFANDSKSIAELGGEGTSASCLRRMMAMRMAYYNEDMATMMNNARWLGAICATYVSDGRSHKEDDQKIESDGSESDRLPKWEPVLMPGHRMAPPKRTTGCQCEWHRDFLP